MHYAVGAKKVNSTKWGTQHAVGMQYTVGVNAKRSTYTVDLANMGGGDCYLQSKKVKHHAMGDAVLSRCWAKRSNPHSGVCSRCTVHSRYTVRSRYTVHSRYTVCSRC